MESNLYPGSCPAPPPSFTALYPNLRAIARARLRARRDTLLDTTALVHESYIRLAESGEIGSARVPDFLQYASRTMRNIVIDSIRRRCAERHGGGKARLQILDEHDVAATAHDQQALDVHAALSRLETMDRRLARVVEMRYFGGMSETEVACALGVTERTVRRDWQKARLLLAQVLSPAAIPAQPAC